MPEQSALQAGLSANGFFLLFGALLFALHDHCSAEPGREWDAFGNRLLQQLYDLGFSLMIAAGSAFFGSVTLAHLSIRNHVEFFLIFLILVGLVLFLQLWRYRLKPVGQVGWTISRVCAIFLGLALVVWVGFYGARGIASADNPGRGANNPEHGPDAVVDD